MSRKKYILSKQIIRRIWTLFLGVLFLYSFLVYRLVDIQILKSNYYKERIQKQNIQKVNLNSGRGIIYDRNKKPLTDFVKEDIMIIQKDSFINSSKIRELVKQVSKLSEKDIYKEIEKQVNSPVFQIKIDRIDDFRKQELLNEGILVSKRSIRYPSNMLLSHTIGYTSKTDNIGETGIERSKEDILKDSNQNYISVFKAGKPVNKEGLDLLKGTIKTVSDDASHIKLTIDQEIQKIVEDIVDKEENPTSVVISDVETGEILSISSRPNFDANNIAQYISEDSSNGELLNRVTQSLYPPGSVFKIVTLYAALETKNIDETYMYNCTGNVEVGLNKEILNCNKKDGHGMQTLNQAFSNSCNTAFYDIASKVGKDKIMEYTQKLKMNEKVGIDLYGEIGGKIPKDISLRNLSIGQGSMGFTPLQINQMTQIIANNGTYRPLYLYDSIINDDDKIIKNFKTSKEEEIISPYTLTIIKDMMKEVSKSGTGKDLKDLPGGSGVKTGTAQSSINSKEVNHGWITGFYPQEYPKYTITVLVEGTELESKPALPIFKEICQKINKK